MTVEITYGDRQSCNLCKTVCTQGGSGRLPSASGGMKWNPSGLPPVRRPASHIRRMDARGPLAGWYANSDETKQLRDLGYCVVKLDRDKCSALRSGFQREITSAGFHGSVDRIERKASAFPSGMWGIDIAVLPLTETAMDARLLMMEKMSQLMGCGEMASSFDGVMIARCGYRWGSTPWFDPARPRVPSGWDKEKNNWTGAHIDQDVGNSETSRSHQCFLALCDAGPTTLSTCIMVPQNGWTLQGITDATRVKFADFFATTKHTSEGYSVPPYIQDWLVAQDMAKAIKPNLEMGDMLVWSSAVIHAAGAVKPPRGHVNNVRLGIISGFCPVDLLTKEGQDLRYACVAGQLRCTGQQVRTPNRHLAWPPALRYIPKEKRHTAYEKLAEERKRLSGTKRTILDDTDEEKAAFRDKLQRLLGPRL